MDDRTGPNKFGALIDTDRLSERFLEETNFTPFIHDQRINLTNEALIGVKLIKLYGWEEPFQKRISGLLFGLFKWSFPVKSFCRTLFMKIQIFVRKNFDR